MNLSANSLYSNSLASLDGIIASSPIYKSAQVKKHNHYQNTTIVSVNHCQSLIIHQAKLMGCPQQQYLLFSH